MRTDDGTAYNLPGLLYHDNDYPDQVKYWKKGITFNLEGLPMIHDDGVQTGVGARGWYNSAVLSAMMLLVLSRNDDDDDKEQADPSNSMRHLLRQDMMQLLKQQDSADKKSPTVLEIGAGAIGLVGMTMAWILSHKQQFVANATTDKGTEEKQNKDLGDDVEESKIILTDNDVECLMQLQFNVNSVLHSLLEFNSVMEFGESKEEDEQGQVVPPSSWSMSDDDIPFLSLPNIQTKVLDWNDHAIDQEVLLQDKIDFVVGTELAYHTNNCCAMQVAKILELHPKTVIWIVQLPRNGWFQVFQRELQAAVPNVQILKMDPIQVDSNVHQMAESIMPMPVIMRLRDIKAVRISIKKKQGDDDDGQEGGKGKSTKPTRTSFDFGAQIEQAQRLSQQLNSAQEVSLDSHWEI